MNRLFLIDIRWVFLVGVFYLIWSRPTEPAAVSVSPLTTPATVTSYPAPGAQVTMSAAQPPGYGSLSGASYRGSSQPFPNFSGVRKFADVDDSGNSADSGNSLSQGAIPVAGGVYGGASYGGGLVIENVVYPYYYWGGYGRFYRERFYPERVHDFHHFEGLARLNSNSSLKTSSGAGSQTDRSYTSTTPTRTYTPTAPARTYTPTAPGRTYTPPTQTRTFAPVRSVQHYYNYSNGYSGQRIR